MSDYETVISDLGGFGPAQVQIFILVSMFETPVAWALLVHPVFAARTPPWTCNLDDPEHTMGTPTTGIPSNVTSNTRIHGNCTLYDDGQCSNVEYGEYTSIVSEWDLFCSSVPSLITTLQMAGALFGAFITGQLADVFGRKKVLFAVYGLMLAAGLGSAFANSWGLYLAMKIVVGGTVAGTMVVNCALPMEYITPRWRTFCGCVGFWACGVMSLGLLAYVIPNWRHLTMTCSLLGIPMFASWWFIPESPRWLLLNGHQKDAEDILRYIASRNNKTLPDLSPLQEFIEREHRLKEESRKYSYWDICRNFQMTKTTFLILYGWFVSSSVYYGTTLSAGRLHGNRFINLFLSGLVEIPALIFVLTVNNRIGRRRTLASLMCLAGVSCLSVLLVDILDVHERVGWLGTTLALIGKSGISGGWAAVQVSSAEVFPTLVRNIGIGSSSMAARVGLIIAPRLADLDVIHVSLPYIVFGMMGLSCGVLCLMLPETLNRPLPDTLPPREYCTCLEKNRDDEPETGVMVADRVVTIQ